jgi:lipopolysaccharide biosynthesis glycosyltransferase
LSSGSARRAEAAVVFAFDRNYERFAVFAATQIARLHPERDFDICLCAFEEDAAVVPSLQGLGFRYCHVDTGGVFSGLGVGNRRTEAMYLRLALPAAFEGEYRRLLYLDSDIFVQGGDFGALLSLDMGGRAVAAVRDNIQWRTPGRRPPEFRRLGFRTAPYLNSGVLLIDVPAYRDSGILGRCIEIGRAHPEVLTTYDQSLLNLTLRGDWTEISPVWNWQYTWASRMFETMADAHIVHFIGAQKPWRHDKGEMPLRFRRAYRAFFREHFPATPVGEDGAEPMGNLGFLRRSLVKHLISAHKMRTYLDRFETDLSVIARPGA